MKDLKAGFIGIGNMGGALAQAVIRSVGAENVAAADKDQSKLSAFCAKYGCTALDNAGIIERCETVFLGIKPQFLTSFAEETGELIRAHAGEFTLVSMLAGTSVEKLRRVFGAPLPVIRIMPNTPAAVGEGMILYTPDEDVSDEAVRSFEHLFRFAGKLSKLPETLIDAGCAISGCGPAFVYMFADAMADAGVALGLTKKQAVIYAAQTLRGAAEMMLESSKSPSDLKDDVCSPGGSTIAGVKALEKDGFRHAVIDAVTDAYQKTVKL